MIYIIFSLKICNWKSSVWTWMTVPREKLFCLRHNHVILVTLTHYIIPNKPFCINVVCIMLYKFSLFFIYLLHRILFPFHISPNIYYKPLLGVEVRGPAASNFNKTRGLQGNRLIQERHFTFESFYYLCTYS